MPCDLCAVCTPDCLDYMCSPRVRRISYPSADFLLWYMVKFRIALVDDYAMRTRTNVIGPKFDRSIAYRSITNTDCDSHV